MNAQIRGILLNLLKRVTKINLRGEDWKTVAVDGLTAEKELQMQEFGPASAKEWEEPIALVQGWEGSPRQLIRELEKS